MAWAAAEGWNPGVHDAACFVGTDPGGFLVGDRDGEPAGCISGIANRYLRRLPGVGSGRDLRPVTQIDHGVGRV